jgi:hypothetical protein
VRVVVVGICVRLRAIACMSVRMYRLMGVGPVGGGWAYDIDGGGGGGMRVGMTSRL